MYGLTPNGKIDEVRGYYSNRQRRHTPTSALMRHSESQFIDKYAKKRSSYQHDSSLWGTLVSMFGCVDTSARRN